MVFIMSDKENKKNKLIIENLNQASANLLNNKESLFTVISINNCVKIQADRGVVIVTDSVKKFKSQQIPKGFVGICAENDKNALKLFKKNKLPVITCGTGNKNTLSISSIADNDMLLCLQRSIKDINGGIVEPCEIKVKANKTYNLFCLLATIAVMFYYKIAPDLTDGVIL